MMTEPLHLEWQGVFNVRDLGGHRTGSGATTSRGALVRADSPMRLSTRGWNSLREYGIRTIVDLRDPQVETGTYRHRAEGMDIVRVPLFDLGDVEFWTPLRGESDPVRLYRSALARWPAQFGAAVRAVAHARPGCVLVHCQVGKDRTGLVAALILSALGVRPEDVAADYGLSAERLGPLYERWGGRGELAAAGAHTQMSLAAESPVPAVFELLETLDVVEYLHGAGLTDSDLARLRERLVEET
jgi:protein-tyrosine phosphatase